MFRDRFIAILWSRQLWLQKTMLFRKSTPATRSMSGIWRRWVRGLIRSCKALQDLAGHLLQPSFRQHLQQPLPPPFLHDLLLCCPARARLAVKFLRLSKRQTTLLMCSALIE